MQYVSVCERVVLTPDRHTSPRTLQGRQSLSQLGSALCTVVVIVYLDAILFHQLHQLGLQRSNLPKITTQLSDPFYNPLLNILLEHITVLCNCDIFP